MLTVRSRKLVTLTALAALAALVALGAACTCSGPVDPCPAELVVGQPCEIVGLECRPATATCTGELESKCICSDKFAGEFVWDCSMVKYCKCACPCGNDAGGTRIAFNTCEALGCVNDPTKPCPAIAAAICELICRPDDAGTPDAGPDGPRPDGPRPDGPLPDAPSPDAPSPDAPTPDAPPPDAPAVDAPAPDAAVPDAPMGADTAPG